MLLAVLHFVTDDQDPAGLMANLFAGLDLVEPGVVEISRWRPESDPGTAAAPLWGGVARKP